MTTPTTALAGKKQKVEQAFSLVFLGFPKRTQDLVNASEFHLVLADFTALADRIIGEREARIAELEKALSECVEEYSYAAEYKGEYLREKHGDDDKIAEYRKLLARAALEDA